MEDKEYVNVRHRISLIISLILQATVSVDSSYKESNRETKYIVKTQALLLRVDLMEGKMAFNAYERSQRQGLTRFACVHIHPSWRPCDSFAFIASSLSCVNIFQSWSWLDVLALVKDVEGVQIDKDVYLSRFACLAAVAYSWDHLSRQGEEVSGLHVLHWGECQIEVDGIHLSTSPAKSSRQSLLNGIRSTTFRSLSSWDIEWAHFRGWEYVAQQPQDAGCPWIGIDDLRTIFSVWWRVGRFLFLLQTWQLLIIHHSMIQMTSSQIKSEDIRSRP